MDTNSQAEYEPYNSPGDRLSHILDQIGFKQGRGRVRDFQSYLTDSRPDFFSDLKYTTVRSWFQESAPPMLKIDAIISALQESYSFNHNIPQIKTWWKVGGYYPFIDAGGEASPTIHDLQKKNEANREKAQFIVMSLVTEVAGDSFSHLTGEELVQLKDSAVRMNDDFADPFKTDCPSEYLKIAIQNELESIISNKK